MREKYVKSRLDNNLKILLFKICIISLMKSKVKNKSIQSLDDTLYNRYTLFVAYNMNTMMILFYPYSK